MHPLTYEVTKLIPRLEFEQFRHMEDRERLNEVRELAIEQVRSDVQESSAERYWRGKNDRVLRVGFESSGSWDDESLELWPARTERQHALEAGLTPLLDAVLTAEQRVQVRLRYDAGWTFEQIAEAEGVSKPAIIQRFGTIHKRIREALERTFEDAAKA